MKIPWSKPLRLDKFGEDYEFGPKEPGVYIIRTARTIKRLGDTDKTGILYIGLASTLRKRIWNFYDAKHNASDFLCHHLLVAQRVLNGRIRTVADVKDQLGELTVRFAKPIRTAELALAERALLFSYINMFGEAPPLNNSLTKRWDSPPSPFYSLWADHAILDHT